MLVACFVCRRCCWGLRGSEDLRTFGVFGVAKIRACKLVYVVSGCCLIVLLLYCVVVVVSPHPKASVVTISPLNQLWQLVSSWLLRQSSSRSVGGVVVMN